MWDRPRLERVVLHMLSNAIKFGEGYGGRVRVASAVGTGTQISIELPDAGVPG